MDAGRSRPPPRTSTARHVTVTIEPRGGWLRPRDGVVEFVETPPRGAGSDVVLAAARFATDRAISPSVVDWIDQLTTDDLAWSENTASLLLDLLRRANSSSWVFLARSRFLQKTFHHVADALDTGADFRAVESLREATAVINAESDTLLLGAFFGTLFPDPRRMGDALAAAGYPSSIVDEIVDLVSGARVLLASVERDGLVVDARFLNHIAHGLRRPGIVERSRLLADALGQPEPWQHAAMIEITTGVQLALARPELLDESAESLEALLRREAKALATDSSVRDRIAEAPTVYVLAHEPAVLVQHVALIATPPLESTVRVSVDPHPTGTANHVINVVSFDRPGLLSKLTAVLAAQGLSVIGAGLATWPDGVVLDSFVVTSPSAPDAALLARHFEDALRDEPTSPHLAEPLPEITLDNSLHPLHSVLRVGGRDQIGLLSAVSHAIASAGVVIHHASVRTTAGVVDDDFEVSRPDGAKIDREDLEAIHRHLAESAAP